MAGADRREWLQQSESYSELKSRLHRYLIRCVDEDDFPVQGAERPRLSQYLEGRILAYITEHRLAVNRREVGQLVDDMIDEMVGLGPLEPLIRDQNVNDILVNGPQNIFVERAGRLERTEFRFIDDEHVIRVVQRILAPLGRRVDESTPMVDARLKDGSRVNAVIPPVALGGPSVSIRKFRADPLRDEDLLRNGSVDRPMLEFLQRAVRARCNVLISGATGAGKTTLLNIVSQWIPEGERVVTIEDTAELRLGHDHVVALETRPPNLEGEREVSARDLVRNALRMRPDRIILGEIRSVEMLDLLQAMNTGHDGSLATVHANNARDALFRLELLAGFAGFNGSERTLREMIASAIDIVVQIERLLDGRRRVSAVTIIAPGLVDGGYNLTDVFHLDTDGDGFVDARDSLRVDGAIAPRIRQLFKG